MDGPDKQTFLRDKFLKVKHELKQVQPQAVWEGVIQADSQWAYADQGSFKMALRQMFKKHDEFVEQAEELQDHVDTNFRDEVLFKGFCNNLYESNDFLDFVMELENA